jgi:predicted Zn finger-like uncharacterized protein
MKVSCQACGAKYTIADDKVRGRKVKIRCKSCGAPIVVDAASEAPPPPDATAAPAAEAPAAAAAPAAGGKVEPWSVNLSDTDQRTMTTDEVVAGWKSGLVTSDAFVWKEGMGDWVAILESDELKSLLESSAAAPDPTATPFGPTIVTAPTASASKGLPAARVAGGRARGGVDLFDAVEGGGEDEVATSAPAFPGMAGTQPYDDGKMTGARNENSVLFSLDALKGGLTAEPAAAKKSAPVKATKSAGSAAADALVASPQSLSSGGASPLFSLSADQALLTAPAAPDPPPRAVEAAAGGGGKAPNKLLIYGGAGVGMVLLLGIGVMLGRSGKDEAKDKGGDNAVASASATPEKKEAKEEKKEEAKTEEPKTEASASASAVPSASAAHKVATGPNTKKETTTSAASATTAKTTTAPKEEAAPAAGTGPFSVSAAQVALTQAATNAAGCKKPDGPTGSGKVQVTFATSGRVTSATVAGPPFAGTPVGGCVAGMFRKSKIPPYAGNPVTVSKSFMIK